MKIITRFAPSPTGPLHVGGMRTALFNYLYAKHYGGSFILRIDDTDQDRNEDRYLEDILTSLKWVNIHPDKTIYQGKRTHVYARYAAELQRQQHTYSYQGALWLRIKHPQRIIWKDYLRGDIRDTVDKDWVIKRQSGAFTYNFCSVVDDLEMGVSHIIRGEDHIPNTAKQIHLTSLFGVNRPTLVHLPLIHDAEGGKISKREAPFSILEAKQAGILPDALLNYLASLGWSQAQEIYTVEEMCKLFNLTGLQLTPARFNMEKLLWVNKHHLSRLRSTSMLQLLDLEYLEKHEDKLEIVSQLAQRCSTLLQIKQELEFLSPLHKGYSFDNSLPFPPKLLCDYLLRINWRDAQTIKEALKIFATQNQLTLRQIDQIIRVNLTGKTDGISIGYILKWLGPEKWLRIFKLHSNHLNSRYV